MLVCLHSSTQLSAVHTQVDRSLHVAIPPHNFRVSMPTHHFFCDCTCTRVTWLDAYAFQEACGGGENMVKNEKSEHLIELAHKRSTLYDLASPDHIDAISNANIWASISTTLDTPNMTERAHPPFFFISTFPEISSLYIYLGRVVSFWRVLFSCTHFDVGQKITLACPCCMLLQMNGDAHCWCGYGRGYGWECRYGCRYGWGYGCGYKWGYGCGYTNEDMGADIPMRIWMRKKGDIISKLLSGFDIL